jgi:hypothetical protein
MIFMQFTVATPQPRLRAVPGIIIILIIVIVAAHIAPGTALPLGLGGWMATYLALCGGTQESGRLR